MLEMPQQRIVGRFCRAVEAVQGGQAFLKMQENGPAGFIGGHIIQRAGNQLVPFGIGAAGFHRGQQEAGHVAGQAQAHQLAAERQARAEQVDRAERVQIALRGGAVE